MRAIVILIGVATTIAILAYNFMREDPAGERPQVVTSQKVQTKDRLDELASALRRFQETNQEQLQQAQLQQTRFNWILRDFDTRLRSVETRAGEQTTHAVAADSAEQGTGTAVRISEVDFGHWMEEALRDGYFDRGATELATEQARNSLAKLPGVTLEDMRCGERFCRAAFAQESGKPPVIQDLFGEPPFLTDGSTIIEADGRVSLYFVRPGESLEELRSDAQNTAESWVIN